MMQSRRNAMHVPDRPGIYKLYSRKANGDLKLVYIGRSTSLRQRVTSHEKPLWDECTFEVVPDETIRKLMEKHLISEFKPVYNKLQYGDPFDTGREEQVLWTFLEEDRFLSLNELADELGEAPVAMEDPLERLCDQGLVETKTDAGKTLYNVTGAIALEEDVANVVDDDRFTPSEQELLDVFVAHDEPLCAKEVAAKAGKPERVGSVRKLLSDLGKKIQFEKERDGRQVTYQLPAKVKQQLGAAEQKGTEQGERLYNLTGAIETPEDIANVVDDDRFNTDEQAILSVFVQHDGFLSYQELAEKLGRPDNIKAIRSRVSDLSKKTDFETKREGRYVRYKLSEKVKQQLAPVVQGGSGG